MTLYIDRYLEPFDYGKWKGGGHLLTTDIDELHEFAVDKLKLRKEWFQDKRFPHYDLVASKRRLALALGATPIGYLEIPLDVLVKVGKTGIYRRYSESLRNSQASKQS